MSDHPPITLHMEATLECPACGRTVEARRLYGATESPVEATGYTQADLIKEYDAHRKELHGTDST